jgi:Zn-dependent peptidase ImmA (M78 family)
MFINDSLSLSEQIVAGFHEFAHLLFHPLDCCDFTSDAFAWNLSKAERQAQSVGVISLMPTSQIVGMMTEDLMREYDVSRRTAEFRLSI